VSLGGHVPQNVRDEIVEAISNTCCSGSELAELHGLTSEDIDDIMGDAGWTICQLCGWWVEIDEVNEDDECQDCIDSRGDV
jgi:hypothetical protein